jgi:hypothetical protein
MRPSRVFLAVLVAASAGLFFSGCASHTANGKNHTVVLGGLYETQEGAYEKQPAASLPVNGDKPAPGSKLTGNRVSILWGLITYRDQ